jgi:outer membrane protein OmpA-like peptidoglycan-associated protein
MLPAEAYADPPGGRVPGPSGVRGGTPPAPPPARQPPSPFVPPFGPRAFQVPFNAGTDRLWGPAQQAISEALRYAAQVKAHQMTVTGYRATIRLSDGSDYVESADVAERRAHAVETAVKALGLPAGTQLAASWQDGAVPSSGLGNDASNRHAAVLVIP